MNLTGPAGKPRLLVTMRLPGALEATGNALALRRFLTVIKDDVDVQLVTGDRGRSRPDALEDLRGVNITILKTSSATKLLWPLRLLPIVMHRRVDAVLCLDDWLGFPACWALSKVRGFGMFFYSTGVLSLYSSMEEHPLHKYHGLVSPLERFVISHARMVLAHETKSVEAYSRYNSRLIRIPPFVDTGLFRKAGSINSSETCKTIGLVGPFNVHNRHTLDHIARNLERIDRRIQFVAIGQCDNRIESERITYTGYLTAEQYLQRLSSLDALVSLEKVDWGPYTKIIEAMSCGLTVFTTPISVIGLEGFEPGYHAIICSEEELVDRMNTLMFDEAALTRIGRNARSLIQRCHSTQAVRDLILKTMQAIVSSPHPTGSDDSEQVHRCE